MGARSAGPTLLRVPVLNTVMGAPLDLTVRCEQGTLVPCLRASAALTYHSSSYQLYSSYKT
jgi:hypothetical protein